MFDWVPLSSYTAVFYYVMMLFMFITLFHSLQNDLYDPGTISFSKALGLVLLVLLIFYMGTRPVSYRFGDMGSYGKVFDRIQEGETIIITKDYLFNYFLASSAKIMSDRMFFLLCAVIYIVPMYLFSKKYLGSYWFYGFFLCAASFSFWPYGVNGIRNGLATSVFIWGLVYYERKWLMYALFAISFGVHNSLMIPIAAFVVSGIYRNPKIYFYIWLASIPLSLAGGGFWGTFFTSLGLGDDRAGAYLDASAVEELARNEKTTFSQTGFRWDFVLYSAAGVFAGWYFLIKNKLQDKFYIHLWGVYMIANAFWILVIRAAFSNRFAYLSWFLMAPVIAYPLLRYKVFPNQYRVIGVVILLYYLFTYFLFLKG